jgi:hypothetical protein
MSENRKIQLETGVDASGAKQGFEEVKQGARDMAQAVAQAGQTAGKGLDAVADGAKRAGDGLNREEGRMRASIQRATLDLQTLGRTASEKIEAKISLQGLDATKLQPYIATLKQVEEAQKAVSNAQRSSSFVDGLKQQASVIGKSKADLLELQAAELGVVAAAAPYIARLREVEKGHNALGGSANFSTQQVQGLVHAVRGAFDSIASGQSPIRAVAVETGRLSGTFGGVGNAITAVASLITPFRVAMVAGAASLGVLALAAGHAESVLRSLNTVQAQLAGTGRADLFSNSGLKDFINELALAPGVTRESATAIVSELSKVHDIGGGLFRDLARSAADYAKATGTDVPTAVKALARAFADPEKGVQQLEDALGKLSSKQIQTVQDLAKSGDFIGAQIALLKALQGATKDLAANGLTPLQKSLDDLGNAWERAMHALDKSDGLRNLNALLGKTIEGVAWLIDHAPKLPGIGAAVSAGVNLNPVVSATRAVATLVGSGTSEKDRTSSGKVGDLSQPGAKGQAAATAGAAAGDDDIKRTLKATEGFKSQAQQIGELATTRERLNKAVKESIAQDKNDPTLQGKPSAVTKELQGRVAGVNERIAAAQKKGAGGGNEPQQVLDAQLQQKIKAAQDALTTERDQLAFSQRYLQGVYSAGEISLKDFYDEKRKTIEQGTAAEIAGFEKERAAVEEHLAKTLKTSPKDKSAIVKDETRLKEIDAAEERARQKSGEELVISNQEAAASFKQLDEQLLNYRANLRQLAGDEAGAARIRNQLADQQDKELAVRASRNGTPISAGELAAAKKGRDDQIALNAVKENTSILNQRLQIEEERIALAQSTGAIGEIEALTREGAARASVVGKMEDQLQALEKLSQERPDDLQLKVDVEGFRLQVDKLKSALDPLKDKFDGIFKDAGANLFGDLMNGTKPLTALKNFANSIGKQINDIVAKDLSNQVFGKGGIFGGAGGSLADLFGGKERKAAELANAANTPQEAFRRSEIAAGNLASPETTAKQSETTASNAAAGALNELDSAARAAAAALNEIASRGTGVPPTTGDFARLDRGPDVEGLTTGGFSRLDRGQTSGEQGVLDMFRDASKSSETLGDSNTKAASAALQLASAATRGGGALGSLPSIVQSIVTAAAQAASASSSGGGLLGGLAGLFGGGGGSAAGAVDFGTTSGEAAALFWSTGGYTGGTDPKKPAGIVHGKEYVFSAPAVQAIGVDRLERLHNKAKTGRVNEGEVPGYSDGGYVTVLGSARPQTLQSGAQWVMAQPTKAGDTYITHHHNYPVTVHAPPNMSRQTAMQAGKDVGRGIELARKRQG